MEPSGETPRGRELAAARTPEEMTVRSRGGRIVADGIEALRSSDGP